MAKAKVKILKIVDTSFPTFIKFELTDKKGISHHFIDKIPIVNSNYDLIPPCIGYMRCNIFFETEDSFIIDTFLPDDIMSLDGKYQFEVFKEQIII